MNQAIKMCIYSGIETSRSKSDSEFQKVQVLIRLCSETILRFKKNWMLINSALSKDGNLKLFLI